jgi:cobalt-zinc-cadmium efflux system outer membrane protein
MRSLPLSLPVLALVACAGQSPYDRARVSQELRERAGFSLRATSQPEPAIPPGVNLGDGLSEDEAVATALWNNGPFQAELATLGLARADLIEAGMIRNPLLTLFLPWGPRQLELTATLPLEALWQRGRRVKAARLDVERVANGLVQTGLDLVRDVKVAHAEVVAAQQREVIARQSREVRNRLAEIAASRLRAGDISVLEAEAVRIDSLQAAEEVNLRATAAASARDGLATLLGLDPARPGFSVPAVSPAAREAGDVEAAVRDALALRPDLRAAELAIEGAAARLGWEKTRIVPNFSAATKGAGTGPEWVIGPGFALEIPLFNQNQGPRARAHAEIERTLWQYAAARSRIGQEVRDAHRRYLHAIERQSLLRTGILPALDENVRRAQKAFAAGEVPYLFVLETMRQRLDAGLREADTTAELARAAAQLDRSIGRKRVRPN